MKRGLAANSLMQHLASLCQAVSACSSDGCRGHEGCAEIRRDYVNPAGLTWMRLVVLVHCRA